MSDPIVFPRGSIAVVSTPIGNPGDLSSRALRVLQEADIVAAEDTRTSRRLLASHGITKLLVSYHDWNEADRAETLLRRAEQGERVALVTDAGTPGMSDPGYDLVRAARQRGLSVFPVPGPSALTAFLSVCGLPTNAFSFFGFPPNRSSARKSFYSPLADRPETLVFFESPRRVVAALADAIEVFGDRECALGREMTKTHEEFLFGDLSSVLHVLQARPKVLGEICWGLRGASARRAETGGPPLEDVARQILEKGLPLKEGAKLLSRRFPITAREAYATLLAARGQE